MNEPCVFLQDFRTAESNNEPGISEHSLSDGKLEKTGFENTRIGKIE